MAGEKCKADGVPIFQGADGAWQHERRTSTETYGGEERRKPVEQPTPKTKDEQPAPKREHVLHRRILGGAKAK